jgi:hypothetical protein
MVRCALICIIFWNRLTGTRVAGRRADVANSPYGQRHIVIGGFHGAGSELIANPALI